jgi:hypothetical protein
MSQWVRLWEDMPTDPKWRVIARRSGRPLAEVVAVFVFMLTAASKSAERGRLDAWDDEDVAAALDLEGEHVAAIRDAMQGKTLDGDRLSGWEKRQPKREDDRATERVKAFREKKAELKRNETQRNAVFAPETDTDTDTEKEEASASSLAEAAEKSEAEELADIAGRLEDATGWVLPGVHLVRDLIRAGHSLDARVIPLASEAAASIRRLGKPRPESWAYLKAIVEDNYREPQAASRASKAAQELVKIPQSDPLWARAAESYQARTGKRPVVVDGVSYFRPEFLPAKEGAAV